MCVAKTYLVHMPRRWYDESMMRTREANRKSVILESMEYLKRNSLLHQLNFDRIRIVAGYSNYRFYITFSKHFSVKSFTHRHICYVDCYFSSLSSRMLLHLVAYILAFNVIKFVLHIQTFAKFKYAYDKHR